MAWARDGGRSALVSVCGLAALVAACGSDAGGGAAFEDGGLTDVAHADGARTDGSGDDAAEPSSCQPASVATFRPTAYKPASGAYQGQCTAAQIGAFYDACLGPSATMATCAPYLGSSATGANAACGACILSRSDAATLGPVIAHASTVSVNLAGCMELTDPTGGLLCAKAYQAADQCEDAACELNCPVSDMASFDRYSQCVMQADTGGCAPFVAPTSCANAEADGGPASVCFAGQSFHDLYEAVAPLFCGVAPPTDGGSGPDAGVVDSSVGGDSATD